MTIKPCVMKAGDLILVEDVKSLTSEQWDKFRGYMKSFGYRIQNEFGSQTTQCWNVSGVMFNGTDLCWVHVKDSDKYKYNIIDKQSILKVTEMTEQKTYREIVLQQIKDKIAETKAEIVDLEKQYDELKKRQTGRTTAIALRTIGEAMSDPYTPIKFVDHVDNKMSNRNLCECIKNLIEKLGLKHLHIDCNKQVLYYTLDI